MDNTRFLVLQIQNALEILSLKYEEIPRVYPDGIYGSETSYAVSIFQKLVGFTENGETDYETFTELMAQSEAYRNEIYAANTLAPFGVWLEERKIKPGQRFETVYILQAMLENLKCVYAALEDVQITGIYDSETEAAVKAFQQRSKLPMTGILDIATWNVLTEVYNNLVRLSQ